MNAIGTCYLLLTYLLIISICVNNVWPSLYVHNPPLFQVELEKDGWQ